MNIQGTGILPEKITEYFYTAGTPLRRMLEKHSGQVRDKALSVLAASGMNLDEELISNGAMLHDIGIIKCHAPSIHCEGTEPYIAHGIIGAAMLRQYGADNGLELEPYARMCERHTGSGITAAEIRNRALPVPEADYLPESAEEKLVCLADKFFSKSGDMQEKTITEIRKAAKFGEDSLARMDGLLHFFRII